jgi:D-proline reductase (dithiol) PrdB
VGLIARELEARGIATVSLTSAWSITAAVKPPRAVFIDFPLGHTAGRPFDRSSQQFVIDAALDAFTSVREPGAIVPLPLTWTDGDDWKDAATGRGGGASGSGSGDAPSGGSDPRSERLGQPQYQCARDRELAEAAGNCATCVFVEPPARDDA